MSDNGDQIVKAVSELGVYRFASPRGEHWLRRFIELADWWLEGMTVQHVEAEYRGDETKEVVVTVVADRMLGQVTIPIQDFDVAAATYELTPVFRSRRFIRELRIEPRRTETHYGDYVVMEVEGFGREVTIPLPRGEAAARPVIELFHGLRDDWLAREP